MRSQHRDANVRPKHCPSSRGQWCERISPPALMGSDFRDTHDADSLREWKEVWTEKLTQQLHCDGPYRLMGASAIALMGCPRQDQLLCRITVNILYEIAVRRSKYRHNHHLKEMMAAVRTATLRTAHSTGEKLDNQQRVRPLATSGHRCWLLQDTELAVVSTSRCLMNCFKSRPMVQYRTMVVIPSVDLYSECCCSVHWES